MTVLVLGASGMVGKAICRLLNLTTKYHVLAPTRQELDLCDAQAVDHYFRYKGPIQAVIVAAGKVGGILANANNPVEFFTDNMAIANNCINTAAKYNVPKLIYLGSSCIYPKGFDHPISEDELLTGPLEKTNEAYALAKICGVKLCEYYRKAKGLEYLALMPCNLYGPGDNYNLETSHVLPALIRKFFEASQYTKKEDTVTLWGTGTPRREFLHVDDLAAACKLMLDIYTRDSIYNVGYGSDISIKHLAKLIAATVGFKGTINFDSSKPDGTMRKLMDSSRIFYFGWNPKIKLEEGIERTYQHYMFELSSGNIRL
jgi:GDP-L-fucose synthase